MNKEYRIIYFKDNRYGNTERYVIVSGSYIDALKKIDYLKSTAFAADVSRYYTLDRQFVMDFLNKEPKLKPAYKDLSHEKFWQ